MHHPVPSQWPPRYGIYGDQRSISRQSKRDGDRGKSGAGPCLQGWKDQKSSVLTNTRQSFFVKKGKTTQKHFYCANPHFVLPPFSYLFRPMFPFSACCRTNGEEEEEEGQQHTGAHAEEEEEERDTERSDIMKLVREREGCPEWDGPPPLSPDGAGAPMS